ncbi:MAG: transporter [Nitrospirae bacterium]|nr:transporter [Nitrospirota bacterium]
MKGFKMVLVMGIMLITMLAAIDCQAVDPFENNVGGVNGPNEIYLTVYPIFYSASKLKDNTGDVASNNLGAKLYQASERLTYYNKSLFGNTIILTGILPVGKTELSGNSNTGIGDTTFLAGYWLVDDPSSGTYIAAGSYFDFPTGDYNKNRAANMGQNVWKFRPTVGVAKQIGGLDMELTFKYNMYTENKDTGTRAGNEMIVEGYTGYFVRPDLLLGAHLNATFGSDSHVDGEKIASTAVRLYQAGPSIMWISGKFSALVVGLADFDARNTAQGYTAYARLSYKLF